MQKRSDIDMRSTNKTILNCLKLVIINFDVLEFGDIISGKLDQNNRMDDCQCYMLPNMEENL